VQFERIHSCVFEKEIARCINFFYTTHSFVLSFYNFATFNGYISSDISDNLFAKAKRETFQWQFLFSLTQFSIATFVMLALHAVTIREKGEKKHSCKALFVSKHTPFFP
jgi:hypothetical protein